MRVFINDEEYQGTPKEINEFLSLRQDNTINRTPFDVGDFSPLVEESINLRQEIAKNPNYNPFGGVVPSKESEPDIETNTISPVDDEDTGVKIQ